MVEKAFYNSVSKKIAYFFIATLFVASFFIGQFIPVNKAFAHTGCFSSSPNACNPATCNDTGVIIETYHANGRVLINTHISNRFIQFRQWIGDEFFINNLLNAMMRMTEQLSAVGMHQMFAVGTIMDAKIQLETQQDFQRMQVQALKDYQPSENYCWFGTNVRSISASEYAARERKMTLNKLGMTRQVGTMNAASGESVDKDKLSRWELFVDENCMVFNNNWDHENPTISGLEPLCDGNDSADSERANRDIHYSRFVDQARTLDDIDFLDAAASDMEKDIISLSRNLYAHEVPKRTLGFLMTDTAQSKVMDLRSVIAKRNVAQNSFNTIVALKTPGTTTVPGTGTGSDRPTKEFIAALIRDLGITDIADISALVGEDPSYYAQLELLSKKIYQDKSFFANLYDKPQNVARTQTAMRAIDLMLDREMYESQLRKEMLISVLLSSKLQENYEKVQADLQALVGDD